MRTHNVCIITIPRGGGGYSSLWCLMSTLPKDKPERIPSNSCADYFVNQGRGVLFDFAACHQLPCSCVCLTSGTLLFPLDLWKWCQGVDVGSTVDRLLAMRQDDGQGIGSDVFHCHGAAAGKKVEGSARPSLHEGTNLVFLPN